MLFYHKPFRCEVYSVIYLWFSIGGILCQLLETDCRLSAECILWKFHNAGSNRDVICMNFKMNMIYKLIKLQNEYGCVLAPQWRIANCDECITSNLFGRDLNSKFGKKNKCLFNDFNTASPLKETGMYYP
jgi:hypothetical protein